MANIWDLPEQNNSVSKRNKKTRKMKKQPQESDMVSNTNQMVNTAANFMTAGMGMAVMANMGSAVIGALSKK